MNKFAPFRAQTTQDAEVAKPVLFLHIPKTAGTSFVTTLQNLFGDNRVLRLAMEDPDLQVHLDALSRGPADQYACINGHLPVHIFSAVLDKYEAFTLLRNPVQRVMSLFRFLRRHSAAQLAPIGLRPGFSFAEFIDTRDHNIYQQINDGMTRALCGDPQATAPDKPRFWNLEEHPAALDSALGLLERIEFGLAEEMELTQARLRARWDLPFPLPPMHLNTTSPGGEETDPHNIRRIIARNTLDIALYEAAAMHFRERRAPATIVPRPDTIFTPKPDVKIWLGNIPGRTGFHPFEEIGFAWLDDTGPAIMHLHPPLARARMAFEFYTIVPEYPANRIIVRLDGRQIPMQITPGDPCWFTLTSEMLTLPLGLRPVEVSFELPYAIPTQYLHPGTPDNRNLGAAISTVEISG